MITSIVGRHIKLTDAIKDYVNSSIQTFEKYNLDIISVTSTIFAILSCSFVVFLHI